MISKIKQLFTTESEVVQTTPSVVVFENKHLSTYKTFIDSVKNSENVPNRVKELLEELYSVLNKSNFIGLNIDLRLSILKIIEIEIPKNIKLYLDLPKAYAVSYILENNKTSKTILIEKIDSYCKEINTHLDNYNTLISKSLINQSKNKDKENKIDFFDM